MGADAPTLAASLHGWGIETVETHPIALPGADEATLGEYDLLVVAGEPRPDLVEACRSAGCLPILALGADPDPQRPRPDFLVVGPAPADPPSAALVAMVRRLIRDRRFSGAFSRLHDELLCAMGPYTHRARLAVKGLSRVFGAREASLYVAETSGNQILPLVAAEPEGLSAAAEVMITSPDIARVLASRSPIVVEDRLAVPIGTPAAPQGVLFLKGPDGPIDLQASMDQVQLGVNMIAQHLQGARVRELWASRAAGFNIDKDQLFQVEKLASLGQLAAGIAHEINNPLFVITGNLEMALEMVEDTPRSLLTKAIKAADRIKKIIFDMRQFFLPTARKDLVQPIDLNELVESAIKIVSLQPSMKNMVYNQDLGADLPKIIGDDNQLLQIFTNLFLNAAQATPGGGTIGVTTHQERGFAVCVVTDTGVGIARENLARIFDPFFTTKQDWFGTGLGLSVTYTIIKNHGGTITADSTPGKGTSFIVKLPIHEVPAPEPTRPSEVPLPDDRTRVLIVDDEDNVREYLEYLLTENGYAVDASSDGAVAVQMMDRMHYPVVVLDHVMPGLNGIETFRRLRSVNPDVCVILLTGSLEVHAEEIYEEGFAQVLMKPCRGEKVLEAIRTGLSREAGESPGNTPS